jgi:lipid-A-disaccharide synthase-like uncharacterized protein
MNSQTLIYFFYRDNTLYSSTKFLHHRTQTRPNTYPWVVISCAVIIQAAFIVKLFAVKLVGAVVAALVFFYKSLAKGKIFCMLAYFACNISDIIARTQI